VSDPVFRRALVIRGGALGDFLLTLPVLAALREAEPDTRLEVLAYPGIAALATGGGLADDARPIEYGPLAGFFTRGAVLDPALRAYFASFDLVISYLYDPDGFFAENLRASGVRRLVEGPSRMAGTAHAVDQLAAPLAGLGLPLAERAVLLPAANSARERTEVFLHPGSGGAAKNWPAENWRRLAGQWLAENDDLHLAILGGEADAAPLAVLRDLAADPRVRLLENLPLPELAREFGAARFYLGHDTGIGHLAALCGTPSLLLFGPTDPAIWAPPHGHVRVLRAPDGDLASLGVAPVLLAARRGHELASRPQRADTGA
jgi:heptosyltransferase III